MAAVFDTRLIPYIPGGAAITDRMVGLPHTGFDVTDVFSDSPKLSMNLSEVEFGALPDLLEIGVEYNATGLPSGWTEAPIGRLLMSQDGNDDVQAPNMHKVQAIGLWWWLANKAYLHGVEQYSKTVDSIGAYTATGITSAVSVLTKNGHNFVSGDRVKVLTRGHAKNIEVGKIYFIRNATTNTFQLSGSFGDDARILGTAEGISLERRQNRLVSTGTHSFKKNEKVTISASGGANNINKSSDYYICQVTSTSFGLCSSPGGTPIELGTTVNMIVNRAIDGDRKFSKRTPGTILRTAIDEAQGRGALSPNGIPLDVSFSPTLDSAGVAWPKQFTIGFAPGTTVLAIIRRLIDLGWIEIGFTGRTLHAWPKGHGVDRTAGTVNPVVIGKNADARPVSRNIDNLLTALETVSADGKTIKPQTSSVVSPLGRLEAYQTQSGVADADTSAAIGADTLTLAATPEEQLSVTETIVGMESLPWVKYQTGDIIGVQRLTGIDSHKSMEIQIRVDQSGKTEVDNTVGARLKVLAANTAIKLATQTGGVKVSGSGTPLLYTDNARPASPVTAVVLSEGEWVASKPKAAVTLTAEPVLVDDQGDDILVSQYELYARGYDADEPVLVATSDTEVITAKGLDVATPYYLSSRALSAAGTWGEFSEEVLHTTAAPTDYTETPENSQVGLTVYQLNEDGESTPVVVVDGDTAQFQSASMETLALEGQDMAGTFLDFVRNGDQDLGPILDRLPWGQLAAFTWTPASRSYDETRKGIAAGSFDTTGMDGRTIRLDVSFANQYVANNTSGNVQFILKVSSSPLVVSDTGDNYGLYLLGSGDESSTPHLPPIFLDMVPGTRTNMSMPPGPTYWFLLIQASAASPDWLVSTTIAPDGAQPRLTVSDVGKMVPILESTNNTSVGSTPPSTGTKQTITRTAQWSRSWRGGGSDIVTGTGQYTDADMLYQGYGASAMGSKFGFSSLGISGSTITSCKLWLKNRYTYSSSGVTARLGTHGSSSAPSTYTGSTADAFTRSFSRGEGQWVDVPSSLWPDIASGAIRGFSLGVSGSSSDYAYFDGADKSSPPKLKITYRS